MVVPNALALVGMVYRASPSKNIILASFGAVAPTGWVVGAAFLLILAQLTWYVEAMAMEEIVRALDGLCGRERSLRCRSLYGNDSDDSSRGTSRRKGMECPCQRI